MRWAIAALVLTWSHVSDAGGPEATRLAAEAQTLEEAGHLDLAVDRYREALREDPDNLRVVEALIPLWIKTERFDAAAEALEITTLRHPRFAAGWYALAFAYRRLGRAQAALLAYQAYINLRPEDADPYYGVAMLHLELGRGAEARAALVQYLRLERRPERGRFVERARVELAALGGAPPLERPPADRRLIEAEALARVGRWGEVERQLEGYRALGLEGRGLALALRAELAAARGRRGEALWPALWATLMIPLADAPWRALGRTLVPALSR